MVMILLKGTHWELNSETLTLLGKKHSIGPRKMAILNDNSSLFYNFNSFNNSKIIFNNLL